VTQEQRDGGVIYQINVSRGGVPKLPVEEARVTRLGILGDGHDDKENHGGPLAALCLYSLEEIERLQAEGHPIAPGTTGENVTLAGVDWSVMTPGARLALGDEVVIELTDYAPPARRFASRSSIRSSCASRRSSIRARAASTRASYTRA
jgi:MOSC domain-containing protein YiiM